MPCASSRSAPWIDGDGRDDGLGCRLGGGGFPGEGVECAQIKPLYRIKAKSCCIPLKTGGVGLHVLSANPFSSQSLSLHSLSLSQTLHFSISVQGRGTFIHEKQQLVDGYVFK